MSLSKESAGFLFGLVVRSMYATLRTLFTRSGSHSEIERPFLLEHPIADLISMPRKQAC